MGNRIPPIVTPIALLSVVLALGATNVAVNTATHTNEGQPPVVSVSQVNSQTDSVQSDSQSSTSQTSSSASSQTTKTDSSKTSAEQASSADKVVSDQNNPKTDHKNDGDTSGTSQPTEPQNIPPGTNKTVAPVIASGQKTGRKI